MTMKKTIAAIAAASVAVSAMATTVSAETLEARTLTYNLVRTVKLNKTEGKITANFDSLKLEAGQKVRIEAIGASGYDEVSFEISGSYWDGDAGANKSFNRIFASESTGEDGYSKEGSLLMGYQWDGDRNANNRCVNIDVRAKSAGTTTSLVASNEVNIHVVAKYKVLPATIGDNAGLNGKIGTEYGLRLSIIDESKKVEAVEAKPDTYFYKTNAQGFDSDDIDLKATNLAVGTYTYTVVDATPATAAIANAGAGATIALGTNYNSGDLNLTYKTVTDADSNSNTVEAWVDDATGRVVDLATIGVTLTGATPAVGASAVAGTTTNTITTTIAAATVAAAADITLKTPYAGTGDADGVYMWNTAANGGAPGWYKVNGDATPCDYFNITFASGKGVGDLKQGESITVATSTSGGSGATTASTITIVGAKGRTAQWLAADGTPVTVVLTGGTPVNGDKITVTMEPGTEGNDAADGSVVYKSTIVGSASDVKGAGETKYPYKSTLDNTADVITRVYSTTDFNDLADGTKEAKLIDAAAIRAVINDAVVNYDDVTFVFNTAAKKVVADNSTWGNPIGSYVDNDWDADKVVDYTSFGRHYWDNAPGYDPNTAYITSEWINNNLFSGVLVINSNLTLSLAATDKFDWTDTSLTFSWDDIQDAALTKNAYANYIHNMYLRTSATWYWDNFQIVLGETEVEEVEAGAPAEGDLDEIDEEEGGDIEDGDIDDGDDGEEEADPEPEAEPEPEPAPAVESNPKTGNAPVALAVIPVALAAAAVVAKKRG